MWQKLSLRARLNTLLALVMVLGLVTNIARLLLEAGPRVAAEDQSVVRLARGFVETLVSDLNDAPDPDARLDQIVEGLKQHACSVSAIRRCSRATAGPRMVSRSHSPGADHGRCSDRGERAIPGVARHYLAPDRRDSRDLGRYRHAN
jgi:two-component system, NarL family, sensor histidine kinase UhpB